VKYRDVKHIVPFIVKVGVMLSPVGYLSSEVPEKWRLLYSCNPLVGLIDSFRYCILGPGPAGEYIPYMPGLAISIVLSLVLMVTGLETFRQLEDKFADYL
jgi:lipopolysaccharide transport system permease protein